MGGSKTTHEVAELKQACAALLGLLIQPHAQPGKGEGVRVGLVIDLLAATGKYDTSLFLYQNKVNKISQVKSKDETELFVIMQPLWFAALTC